MSLSSDGYRFSITGRYRLVFESARRHSGASYHVLGRCFYVHRVYSFLTYSAAAVRRRLLIIFDPLV